MRNFEKLVEYVYSKIPMINVIGNPIEVLWRLYFYDSTLELAWENYTRHITFRNGTFVIEAKNDSSWYIKPGGILLIDIMLPMSDVYQLYINAFMHRATIIIITSEPYKYFPGPIIYLDGLTDKELNHLARFIDFKYDENRYIDKLIGLSFVDALNCLKIIQKCPTFDLKKFRQESTKLLQFEGVSGERLGGCHNLRQTMKQLKIVYQHKDKAPFLPKAYLFVGPPGTGKSLASRYLAAELNLPLASFIASRIVSSFYGETTQNFERVLVEAEMLAPIVLRLDEIEKILAAGQGTRYSAHEETQRAHSVFLTYLEERLNDVLIIGTCNYPFTLSPPILNRFERIFGFSLPNKDERIEILKIQLEQLECEKNVDLEIAAKMEGFSGRDIRHIVRKATFEAFARNPHNFKLTTNDIVKAMKNFVPISIRNQEEIALINKWIENYAEKA
ncbi:MAG: ATP-binding protein [Candidatus Micrarchaeia archaeon]